MGDNQERVHLTVEHKPFGIFVTSAQVPGLFLGGPDTEAVFDSVIEVIKDLYLHNRKWVVDVEPVEGRRVAFSEEQMPRDYIVTLVEERALTA